MDDFLGIPRSAWVAENEQCFAIRDRFPVTPGHTLVITRRNVATWFDATAAEQQALMMLVAQVKEVLDHAHHPDGYNIGFNSGEAAGQTVMHLHVHVIPRYRDDMEDPRGGVRHVIPAQGNYKIPGYQHPDPAAPSPSPEGSRPSGKTPKKRAAPLVVGGDADHLLTVIRPLLDRAENVAIVAAFLQDSGLALLQRATLTALERGAQVRLLTGDYLRITQVEALERLLDWLAVTDRLQVRVIESANLALGAAGRTPRSFHPKSWRFEGADFGVAYVGSSNVSKSALTHGIEWNLRAERSTQPEAYAQICAAFEALWLKGAPLDEEWVQAYARRVALDPPRPAPGEGEDGDEPDAIGVAQPHQIQREALAALALLRSQPEPRRRALVVLATGLGKTWLAAFDVAAFALQHGRFPRVLFIAHQEHLLRQASKVFRRLLRAREERPAPRISWCVAERADLSGDVVFASVQKLMIPAQLVALQRERFDYVVVDEVHHATAPSYQKILARVSPAFLLGLTATPDRMDEADLLDLFDDCLAYRADIGVGITRGLLAPFAYYGIPDVVSYENVPVRGLKFDETALSLAVAIDERMQQLWRAWKLHDGKRTVVFCVSVPHAQYVRDWLRAHNERVESVHSAEGAADLEDALSRLGRGELDVVCAVNMLNEGIDLPSLDRVVMLRPSESPVVFMQQLGRGLRKAPGKTHLTVIDFVGNHRIFLERLRLLLSICGQRTDSPLRRLIDRQPPVLPPGCSVELEVEALAILRRLMPRPGRNDMVELFREQCAVRERRPSAREFFHLGFALRLLYPARAKEKEEREWGWFDFLLDEDRQASAEAREAGLHLSPSERAVLAQPGVLEWLREVETTEMTRCYKMVLLQALIEGDALSKGMALEELAKQSLQVLRRSPELERDLAVKRLARLDRDRPGDVWQSYWNDNPVNAWAGESGGAGKRWFQHDGERLVSKLPEVADQETLKALTKELVDYRLAGYRSRDTFLGSVAVEGGEPLLRAERRPFPEEVVQIRLNGAHLWQLTLEKKVCRDARPVGGQRNRLGDLLRAWFGPDLGAKGERCQVRLDRGVEWTAEPIGAAVLPLKMPLPRRVPVYRDLIAAAGALTGRTEGQDPGSLRPEEVDLPIESDADDVFAVRVSGRSMEGGSEPIADGDWLIFKQLEASDPAACLNRIVLAQELDRTGDVSFLVKRVGREGEGWVLRSANPDFHDRPFGAGTRILAELIERVAP